MGSTCITTTYQTHSLEFIAPYSYRYACSFSLLSSYSNVFVYMFLITAFVSPVTTIVMRALLNRCTPDSLIFNAIADMLPALNLPPEKLGKWKLFRQCFSSTHQPTTVGEQHYTSSKYRKSKNAIVTSQSQDNLARLEMMCGSLQGDAFFLSDGIQISATHNHSHLHDGQHQ